MTPFGLGVALASRWAWATSRVSTAISVGRTGALFWLLVSGCWAWRQGYLKLPWRCIAASALSRGASGGDVRGQGHGTAVAGRDLRGLVGGWLHSASATWCRGNSVAAAQTSTGHADGRPRRDGRGRAGRRVPHREVTERLVPLMWHLPAGGDCVVNTLSAISAIALVRRRAYTDRPPWGASRRHGEPVRSNRRSLFSNRRRAARRWCTARRRPIARSSKRPSWGSSSTRS